MGRLNDDADAIWLQSRMEALGDFSGHFFLNLQSTRKNRNEARKL
jgi:hypothetical protein